MVLPLSTAAYLVQRQFNEAPVSCLSPSEATLLQLCAYGYTPAPPQWLFTDDHALPTGAKASRASISTYIF